MNSVMDIAVDQRLPFNAINISTAAFKMTTGRLVKATITD